MKNYRSISFQTGKFFWGLVIGDWYLIGDWDLFGVWNLGHWDLPPALRFGLLSLIALLPLGCVQREMTVISDPPGAVVSLNDREMGRTPFKRSFLWYGNYDVVLRKDGYETLKTSAEITAPFWQFMPFDLVTDFLPLKDEETISFTLKPQQGTDPNLLVVRGEQMRQDLQSSEHTVHKSVLQVPTTTRPATEVDSGQ